MEYLPSLTCMTTQTDNAYFYEGIDVSDFLVMSKFYTTDPVLNEENNLDYSFEQTNFDIPTYILHLKTERS